MLIDSNIIIYAVQPENKKLRFFLETNFIICSQITILETLGYHLLTQDEKSFLEQFFAQVPIVRIEDGIIEIAIKLKQAKKMSIADAIIASTALYYNYPLVTNNENDFEHIKGLYIVNPLK